MGNLSKRIVERAVSGRFSYFNFQAMLLMLTGLLGLLFIGQVIRLLPVTSDNMYPESAGVLSALRWAHGLSMYQDYRQAPYLITPFPPLWYAFLVIGTKLGFADLNLLTWFGRILSLASLFGMMSMGYMYNRRLGFARPLAALTPAFYLSFPLLIPWAVTARPDLLALCFGCLAIYLAGVREGSKWIMIAAVIAAMAFLCRHNAVAVPVAVVIWFACCKRWKDVALFSLAWWLVVGTTLLEFQRITHGLLLFNLSGATFGRFAISYIRDIAGRVLAAPGNGFALALFAFGLFGFMHSWKYADRRIRLLSTYAVVSLGLAVLGSAARGAAVNHYMEPAFALAMLIPVGLLSLEVEWKESSLAGFAMVLVLVFLLPAVDVQRSYFRHNKPDDLQDLARLVENKRVFTDIPYLAARTSNLELMEPASLMNTEIAGERTKWSSAKITEALERREYQLVVLGFPLDAAYDPDALYPRYVHLDSAVRGAIANNYHLCLQQDTGSVDGAVETRYVYAPTSATDATVSGNCPSFDQTSSEHSASVVLPNESAPRRLSPAH
jgi:hypothetical protein